jgi:phage FluMu protein Com
MAVERLKIRCYQCNQLLAVLPNKAGTVVACPKCKADLLIPRLESPSKEDEDADHSGLEANSSSVKVSASNSGSPSSVGEPSPFLAEIAAVIPPELAALRPEDLRVEAEFFEALTHRPPVTPTPRPDPFQFPTTFSPETLPAAPEAPGPSELAFESGFATAPISAPPPLPVPQVDVVVPPIQFETSPILPPATETRRIREVTLPATVVLAWSLFVLASTAMSFIAGLMIGHYLWKNTP